MTQAAYEQLRDGVTAPSEERNARMAMRYREKPTEIDAMHWDGTFDGFIAIAEWAKTHDALHVNIREYEEQEDDTTHLIVAGLRAEPGDYVVHDVRSGAFSVCAPATFAATYEAADYSAPVIDDPDADNA